MCRNFRTYWSVRAQPGPLHERMLMPRNLDVAALVEQTFAGNRRALARLLSAVENDHPALPEISQLLAPRTGRAEIIGLTGSPGVGKSTATNALVAAYRAMGRSVAVLAVDPSSPFSGGALLGDRIRMVRHSADAGVYVRSMATRGHLGGLAEAVPAALRVLDAAGFDIVLIETVGVGQSEVHVAGLADTVLVLVAPGMGDGIQAAKAGVLEIADVFVVNKADHDGAAATVRDLRYMISLGRSGAPDEWRPPVVSTVAEQNTGIDELVTEIAAHRAWMRDHGELDRRQHRRARDEIEGLALARVRTRLETAGATTDLDALADAVVARETDPYAAAARAVEHLR